MKTKNVLRLLTIMMAAVLSVGFASCGSDDDGTDGGGSSTPGTGIDGGSVTYGNGMDGTTLNIRLSSAGTLSSYITDENMYKITRLKVSGQLNGTDIWLLRQMAGSDEKGESTNGVLGYLDMSDATIVAGGRPYFYHYSYEYYNTEDGKMSSYMFYKCRSLVSLSCPDVTEIGYDAFEYCSGLTTLVLPKHIEKVGSSIFYDCKNLKSITILNPVPPKFNGSFSSGVLIGVTVYIPKGSKSAYLEKNKSGYSCGLISHLIYDWGSEEEALKHIIELN